MTQPEFSRKRMRLLVWAFALPFVAAAALIAALWFWTDSDTSLASALSQATRYLPAGQSLTVEGIHGSLRRGGHIEMLRWKNGAWTIEARQIDLAWQPLALLDRRLQLESLRVSQLTIEGTGTSSAHTPLDQLLLPFQVDVKFMVDALRWTGPPVLDAQQLAGRYQFDHQRHSLNLTSVQVVSGQYNAQATLLARAPLSLEGKLQGKLETSVPGGNRAWPLDATVSIKGDLAGLEGLLDVQAELHPSAPTAEPMRAKVSAQVKPWVAQPVVSADATFSQLNLSVLWPQAPQTLLTGHVQVVPQGVNTGITWQAQGNITNSLSGPIDKGRLPVESALAQITFDQGQWLIQSLNAKVAGGSFQVQGQLGRTGSIIAAPGVKSSWQGNVQLQSINPNAIHSQLADARIDGKLTARAVPPGVEFDAKLEPSARQTGGSRLQGLRLRSALAKGLWADQLLTLQTLRVQTEDALLQGHVTVQLDTKASAGLLQLTLPGGQARMEGQLAARTGAGDVALRVTDAALATGWLAKLPGVSPALTRIVAEGSGTFTGHWQGGWQSTASHSGHELTVQGNLQVPQLDLREKTQLPANALHLREVSAELSGRISALTLALRGQAQMGTRRIQLQTQASGGRSTDGTWQGQFSQTTLQAQDSVRPGTWTVLAQRPFDARWKSSAAGDEFRIGASEASLTGPLPGAATVVWQPLQWRRNGQRTELTTQGQIRGLPMAWLELFGNAGLASMGLSGNLLFDGEWDAVATDTLKLRASLMRRSGDLQVRTDLASTGATVNAGVKDARMSITTEGDVLRATLRWDSERAGIAQADFSSRISRGSNGWSWASDAPLTGSLQAKLPKVGVWSVLAPPGWRIRGTLEANIALAGNRSVPQWSGTLQANDLALRSVVNGIEFSNGRLRTTLRGQRLDITEFSLQGAGGGDGGSGGTATRGGQLTAKGFAVWQPDRAGQKTGLSSVHMELDAAASALRLSARADRRLVVSGKLQARLDDAKLEIRGDLKADQALFILPDETAPSLGSDVVIKPSSRALTGIPKPDTTATAGAAPTSNATGLRVVPDVMVTLDLGPDFRVEGRGLATRLSGVLNLRSVANTGATPRLTGEVQTRRGTYKAYGQLLDIDEGMLRFTGAYDNPALDILAIRPNLAVRVGVQITGTALAPRVRLYADPELPEAEKLAWLVLGRSGANGGAESALLQQAALALLGGNGKGLSGGLASALGLDELSFAGSAANSDGSTTSATVTLGKRISRDFYVAYERSLAGTLGTFSIFYDLSRRFTLRARTGEQSAIDLIFTVPYD